VKCRQLPADGRLEERVSVGASKKSGFDFLAVVIFNADFTLRGAVLVPYSAVWRLTRRQRYNRISYPQAVLAPGSIDITRKVRNAANA
jgi:hypothetical protein